MSNAETIKVLQDLERLFHDASNISFKEAAEESSTSQMCIKLGMTIAYMVAMTKMSDKIKEIAGG